MSQERAGQDLVIARGAKAQSLLTPEELITAEAQRIVGDTWELYLTIAGRDPDIEFNDLLDLYRGDEDDRDYMAQIVEEYVSEALETWEANKFRAPDSDTLALIMVFLGMRETQPPRGDLTLREFCLHQFNAYNMEQSETRLAASAASGNATPASRQSLVVRRCLVH